MTSYKTFFLIKCLSLWNRIIDTLSTARSCLVDFYSHWRLYFQRNTKVWYLFPGHTHPLSALYRFQYQTAPWMYDSGTNRLTYHGESSDEALPFRIGWLSGKIREPSGEEHPMDEFLEDVTIQTPPQRPPPLSIVMMAWSIYRQRWLEKHSRILWINEHAEDQSDTLSSESPIRLRPAL